MPKNKGSDSGKGGKGAKGGKGGKGGASDDGSKDTSGKGTSVKVCD